MNKDFTKLIVTVGRERLAEVFADIFAEGNPLAPWQQLQLEQAVEEFFVSAPWAMDPLLQDPALRETREDLLSELLQHAHERAPSARLKDDIRRQAEQAGLASIFAGEVRAAAAAEPRTRAQTEGLERMDWLLRLHFAGKFLCGIEPRTWPLIIGPSGVGKSNLARQLAARHGLPLVKVTFGDWLVSGAKCDTTTLNRLAAATREHARFVLFIDELDKMGEANSGWTRSLLAELYGVLDRQLGVATGGGSSWTPQLVAKFRRGVFVVGAGTWQRLWREEAPRAMGFGAQAAEEDIAARIRRAGVIPEELVNRFNPDWVVLPPFTAADFRDIAGRLGLGLEWLDPAAAAAAGLNFRAVERAVAELALHELRNRPEQAQG